MLNCKSLKNIFGNVGMVAHMCNPSMWETETGGYPGLHNDSEGSLGFIEILSQI